MRQPINFTQTDLDELAEQATGLSNWLEEKPTLASSRIAIPQKLTTVASFIIVSGLLVLMDNAQPATACWGGNCVS